MRTSGMSVPNTPSRTMPSRTPMMSVVVMSRFLIEERRIRRRCARGFYILQIIVATSPIRRASRDPAVPDERASGPEATGARSARPRR
jgi:hypothetical protein